MQTNTCSDKSSFRIMHFQSKPLFMQIHIHNCILIHICSDKLRKNSIHNPGLYVYICILYISMYIYIYTSICIYIYIQWVIYTFCIYTLRQGHYNANELQGLRQGNLRVALPVRYPAPLSPDPRQCPWRSGLLGHSWWHWIRNMWTYVIHTYIQTMGNKCFLTRGPIDRAI